MGADLRVTNVSVDLGRQPGRRELSPRQRSIVLLISEGLADKEIAARLGISSRTVRTHLERLFLEFALRNRAHAVSLLLHDLPGRELDRQ